MDDIRQGWPAIWRQWQEDPSEVTIPGGESLADVAERAVRAFHGIILACEGKQSIIVAHEGVLKVLVAHIVGAPDSIYRKFEMGNASLSVVRITGERFQLVSLNDTTHLNERKL